MTPISGEAVIDEASVATGLDDFGPPDFRDGLTLLCESIEAEAQLNALGEIAVRDTVVSALAARLRVVDWIGRNPAVTDERIDAPIIVMGCSGPVRRSSAGCSTRTRATVRSCDGRPVTPSRLLRRRATASGRVSTRRSSATTCWSS